MAARLQFIDNIRWAMIVLVIFHHSAVTYSHLGSWYYNENPAPSLIPGMLMATFLVFNQAYFMGFLFLIAGYFAAPSLDRKGTAPFLRDRLIRLGLPTLLFVLVIHPVIVYWLLRDFYEPGRPTVLKAYVPFLTSGRVFSATGPMWFALALLIFCIVYALIRRFATPPSPATQNAALPQHKHIVLLALFIAICTFIVRIFQPIGTSVLNMQLCNFSQYSTLFCIGILAYRRNWLVRIPYAFGMLWFRLAVIGGALLWLMVLLATGVFQGAPPAKMFGGLHLQSALNSLWESFVCLGLCLGVLVLFRDRIRVSENFAAFMSRNAFSAYLFHTGILIAVTLSLHKLAAPILVKFLAAGAIAVVVSFLSSEYIFRRIPLLRRVL